MKIGEVAQPAGGAALADEADTRATASHPDIRVCGVNRKEHDSAISVP
jgi:hypothetical protein